MKNVHVIIILTLWLAGILNSCKKEETKPEEPEKNFTNFKILSIKLTAMPFLDKNSAGWDLVNGPDVFVNIETQNGDVLLNGTSSRFQDVPSTGLPLNWNLVNAHQITNLTVTHFVTVYDYDSPDPNDEMGYVGFTMSNHTSGWPKTVTQSRDGVTVTISGEWY